MTGPARTSASGAGRCRPAVPLWELRPRQPETEAPGKPDPAAANPRCGWIVDTTGDAIALR